MVKGSLLVDGALPPPRSPSPGTVLSLLVLHSSKKSKISPGLVRGEGRERCVGSPVGQEGSEGHRTPSRGLGPAPEEHPKTSPCVPAVLWQWGRAAPRGPHCREHPAGMEMPQKKKPLEARGFGDPSGAAPRGRAAGAHGAAPSRALRVAMVTCEWPFPHSAVCWLFLLFF